MNKHLRYIVPLVIIALIGVVVVAQEGPRPPRPQDGPGNFDDPMRPPPPHPQGAGRPDPARFAEALRNYIDTVDRFVDLSEDPTASGVAAVLQAKDLLERKSPEQAIAYFLKVQPNVKNDAVRRAIDLQLVELYKKDRQPEKALDILQNLMTAAPAGK